METAIGLAEPDHRVCVWCEHKIVDHVSDPEYAERFEAVTRRRSASLRLTNEPVVSPDDDVS